MTNFLLLCVVIEFYLLIRSNNQTNEILEGVNKIMADINVRLQSIEKRLVEASAEILALIEKLKNEQLTDEGRKALDGIEAIGNALADIVKEEPPPPTP